MAEVFYGTIKDTVNRFESQMNIPSNFIINLILENDWSFIIKLHAFIETAINQLLIEYLQNSNLEKRISWLPLSDARIGKIAFLKDFGLLNDYRALIRKISEIRNDYVHDISNVNCTLQEYLQKNEGKRLELEKFSKNDFFTKLSLPDFNDKPKENILIMSIYMLSEIFVHIDFRKRGFLLGKKQ